MAQRDSALKRLVKASPIGPLASRVVGAYRRRRSGEDKYDRLIVQVMGRVLDKDSNCVDAGAHWGKILQHIVRLAPSGTHYAFEPLPGMATLLKQRFPAVRVMEIALGDVTETARFRHVLSEEAYSGFERRPWDAYEEDVEMIDVEVRPLDEVLPSDIPIRFIKLDVEGSEYRFFQGAQRTLRANKPFVAFELGSDQPEVFDLLMAADMRVSLIEGWLAGKPPLDRDGFLAEVHNLRAWTFLAHGPQAGS